MSVGMPSQCDVLIVGASFAGVEVYRGLRRSRRGRALSTVIVDRQAEHGYIPLSHERLTSRLPLEVSTLETARYVARDPNARYQVAEVERLDAPSGTVWLRGGASIRARFVVIAVGSELRPPPSLNGAEHLLSYKFAHEFAQCRSRLLTALDQGTPVSVIGGGISGVELAGDIARSAATRSRPSRVTLLEAGDRLLSTMSVGVADHAMHALQAQGVEVRLHAKVQAVTPDALFIEDGAVRATLHGLGIWAAGVRPNALLSRLELPRTAAGFLAVPPTLLAAASPGAAHVFACGDAVRVVAGGVEWNTMQRAIECLWQAHVVADNVLSLADGDARPLRAHKLRADFPYGVSMGASSTIVYGRLRLELGRVGVWFRRFLMRQYIRRYARLSARLSAGRTS